MDELQDALIRLGEAQDENHAAVQRFVLDVQSRFEAEGRLIADLRDDLHALANRVEAVTRTAVALPFHDNPQPCHQCGGTGAVDGDRCPNCDGFGEVRVASTY